MKKYNIFVKETLEFTHKIEIEVNEEELSKSDIDNRLNKIEEQLHIYGWDCIQDELKENELKVAEISKNYSVDEREITISNLEEEEEK